MAQKIGVLGRSDMQYFNEAEAEFILPTINNLGDVLEQSNNSNTQWAAATPPSVTSGNWYQANLQAIQPNCGRKIVLNKVIIEVTAACQLCLIVHPNLKFSGPFFILDNSTTIGDVNANGGWTLSAAAAGTYTFDFGYMPLTLRGGNVLGFLYCMPVVGGVAGSVPGVNWQVTGYGYDLCDDDNFDAPYTIGVISDSIGGFTTDPGAYKYNYRVQTGITTGSWPFIIQEQLKLKGIDTRQWNIGIGGTNAIQWDWWVNNGRISNLSANLVFINLGMNDCNTTSELSTAVGMDGIFKQAMKNIILAYFRKNPNGSCIVNSITPTDVSGKLTVITSGIYNGLTYVAAFRQELAGVVTDMVAAYPQFDLQIAHTDTAFSPTAYTYYIMPQTPNNNVHPNTQLGQPAMASVIFPVVQNSKFYKSIIPAQQP